MVYGVVLSISAISVLLLSLGWTIYSTAMRNCSSSREYIRRNIYTGPVYIFMYRYKWYEEGFLPCCRLYSADSGERDFSSRWIMFCVKKSLERFVCTDSSLFCLQQTRWVFWNTRRVISSRASYSSFNDEVVCKVESIKVGSSLRKCSVRRYIYICMYSVCDKIQFNPIS